MELLRLLRWCRFLAPATLETAFTKAEIANLAGAGYIKRHAKSWAYVLTVKGGRLLGDAFAGDTLPQMQRAYRETDIQRRLYIACLTVTAFRAGVHVFTDDIEDLRKEPALFLPSNSRGRGANPWANTRIAAVAALGGTAYAAHYVRSGIGRILFSDELAAFARNISLLRTPAQAFLFFGDSYGELLAELEHSEEKDEGRLISYGEAYRRLRLPAHLLTCDDAGVTQLRIMSTPNYRAKLTRIALKSKYTPPPEDLPQCDALFDGAPFLLAADMDLRRIDAAAHAARERRCGPIVLAALEAQAEAVLYGRYRDTGKARVFTLTDAALKEFLGAEAAGRDPSQLLFTTAKGEVIHAPLIKAH